MLNINNQYTYLRKELLVRFFNFLFNDENREAVNRIPYEMIPVGDIPRRCCIYKDREMIKFRLLAMMGYCFDSTFDESCSLSEFFSRAERKKAVQLPPLTVIKAACSACKKGQYSVTELCKGCLARPCQTSCPKNAVSIKDSRAVIDQERCINCGKCRKSCPYSAIVYTPVPCEEVCPVGAVEHSDGTSIDININKCISCGKCTRSCPFGAIVERSHILPVVHHLKNKENLTLMVAPSLFNQLPGTESQILSALKSLGFSRIYSLKESAEIIARSEADELTERLIDGAPFMTTSCCPAYVETVKKHIKGLESFLSHTESPMIAGADIVKDENKDTKTVFAGPCLAKKVEAFQSDAVDFVLTFEELGTLLISRGVEISNYPEIKLEGKSSLGLGFARSGGVARAVEAYSSRPVSTTAINGITSKTVNLLRSFAKRPPDGDLVEVMACEGGCEKGPCSLS